MNKNITLVLGSGGARGLAHIGVLKVLEQKKVPIKAIVGTSIGTLIGGLYAAGLSAGQIEETGLNIKFNQWLKFIDFNLMGRGLIKGEAVEKFLYRLIGQKEIKNLPIDFTAVGTDIEKGKTIIIKDGDLVKAIRISISIPGLFKPVQQKDTYLVDGGIINPVAVDIARNQEPDNLIIAVNVCADLAESTSHLKLITGENRYDLYKIVMRSIYIMENEIAKAKLKIHPPDILIKPDVHDIHILDFHKIKNIIKSGEEAAEKIL